MIDEAADKSDVSAQEDPIVHVPTELLVTERDTDRSGHPCPFECDHIDAGSPPDMTTRDAMRRPEEGIRQTLCGACLRNTPTASGKLQIEVKNGTDKIQGSPDASTLAQLCGPHILDSAGLYW
jgi:hypothetical protein